MIEADKRKAVFLLHQEGMSIEEIVRRFQLSRNTVRTILKQKGEMPVQLRKRKVRIETELLERLYRECNGWAQRVNEKLVEEEGIQIPYSTWTRLLREMGLSKQQSSRCDRVPDTPGAEMQHDTSPYCIRLGDTPTKLIASLLYLRYSKRRYLKFFRVFNRFRMKCFLHTALLFWRYAAAVCIIDNTNLARLRGTGRNAVLVPEMAAFAKEHGFRFVCHEKGHANRKAGEERSFWTVETNFLPGRHFASPEGMPKPERQPKDRRRPTEEEEKRLRALSPTVGNYLDFVLPSRSGIERHHFLRELFVWAERLTPALFLSVVERALRYGITDLATLERIARLLLRQGGEMPLPGAEVDESFQDREAYQQGRLTDAPDFSSYDQMLEEPEEEENDG